MDAKRFDDLAKDAATNERGHGALKTIGGVVAGLGALAFLSKEASADNVICERRCIRRCRRRCASAARPAVCRANCPDRCDDVCD